jgi:hypothetical protein
MPAKKICFFVTPIGHANSPERKRANDIQKFILMEVLAPKYKVLRADELPQPGSITHQVIKWLYEADLVIADLTGLNANVIYELGIRHSFNRISVHLIDKAATIPFDLKDERTITVDLADVADVDECKRALARNIKEIERKGFTYSSPIFRVLGVAAATPEAKEDFLATMADKIESISSDLSSIETEIMMSSADEVDRKVDQMLKDTYDIKLDIRRILGQLSSERKA